jgi:hypothetical protein
MRNKTSLGFQLIFCQPKRVHTVVCQLGEKLRLGQAGNERRGPR